MIKHGKLSCSVSTHLSKFWFLEYSNTRAATRTKQSHIARDVSQSCPPNRTILNQARTLADQNQVLCEVFFERPVKTDTVKGSGRLLKAMIWTREACCSSSVISCSSFSSLHGLPALDTNVTTLSNPKTNKKRICKFV